jgi:predicted phosphodiesterase
MNTAGFQNLSRNSGRELQPCSRRSFIGQSFLGLATLRTWPVLHAASFNGSSVRFGILTDVHFADISPQGNRYYQESPAKMREGIDLFNQVKPDFVVELGDYIDAAEDVETELKHLLTIEKEFARFDGPRHYVLGNHCVWTLNKNLFLENSGALEPYYSFDVNGFHFVVLDACYRADGVPYGEKNFHWTDAEIPAPERAWLAEDLEKTTLPAVVFVHHRLDADPPYGVKSAEAVRKILQKSEKVLAVFQGHNHINEHQQIEGIHYCTLQALVEGSGTENNAYSVVEMGPEAIHISGYRRHRNYTWTGPNQWETEHREQSKK